MAAWFSCFDLSVADPGLCSTVLKIKVIVLHFYLFWFIYIVIDNAVLGAVIKTTQENMFFTL